jgi:hypothetical protein
MNFVSLLPIILLVLILTFTMSCAFTEQFTPAPLDYVISSGDQNRLEEQVIVHDPIESTSFLPAAGVLDPDYPLIKDESGTLFPFENTKCSPACCANSNTSCNHGCVCMTEKVKNLLRTRGGNRTNVGNNF